MIPALFDRIIPRPQESDGATQNLDALLAELGFDRIQHEQIRADLRSGRIGLAQNRLPASTVIEDVNPGDVVRIKKQEAGSKRQEAEDNPASCILHPASCILHPASCIEIGQQALQDGMVAVVTLAAGVGSRWTHGAGVVKALHPFCKLGGRHRSFLEVHLAKSRRVGRQVGTPIPHVITTSYLTHDAIEAYLETMSPREERAILSPGRAVGLRLIRWRVTCVSPGGDAAAIARRAGAESAREPPRCAHRLGGAGRRGQRLPR
jgi:hypothetical protein